MILRAIYAIEDPVGYKVLYIVLQLKKIVLRLQAIAPKEYRRKPGFNK